MIFENIREVDINAVNGRIEIESWENDYVEVNYTVHGDVDVEIEQDGDRLVIEEKPKKKLLNLRGDSDWAEIWVKVPRNVLVKAKNVNGELEARGVRFEEATTVNGRIELKDCEAEKLSTVNGKITAHLTAAGPLEVSAVNGKAELTIEDLEGDVEAKCVNGGITLRLTEFCDARIVTGRANAGVSLVGIDPDNPAIGTGEFEVRVKTINGYARVELV